MAELNDASRAAIALEIERELPALEEELRAAKRDKELAALIRDQIAIRKQYLAELAGEPVKPSAAEAEAEA